MKSSGVIDWSDLEERFGGDRELIEAIAQLFLEHVDRQISELSEAVHSQNAEAVWQEAHRIKGSLAQVAAREGQELAFELESAGRLGDLSQSLPLLDRILAVVHEAKAEFLRQLR
ncbi:MAG: hypothetical protein CSA62_12345 [Planctomycetota bacterium]|nr:MAG: hypothetical protein CSA62_12345 [Planctomycetota bacterium]